MSLQGAVPTPPCDHSPIFRAVPALITFFHQLNMAIRFPKILFTTAAPILTLLRFLSLHWSSRKHEAADAGVRDRRFDRFSLMELPDLSLEQLGIGSARICRFHFTCQPCAFYVEVVQPMTCLRQRGRILKHLQPRIQNF
jgi:hypothetical protein